MTQTGKACIIYTLLPYLLVSFALNSETTRKHADQAILFLVEERFVCQKKASVIKTVSALQLRTENI